MPGNRNDVGDALHTLAQNVVGDAEALEEACVLGNRQQLLVGDHDHRVHALEQFLQAALGLLQTALALERERPRDDRNGQNPHLAGERRNHWSRPGSGASAKARRHKHHVRAFESLDDLFGIFERRATAHVGIRARTQPGSQPHAKLQLYRSQRQFQRLHIGIRGDELNAFEAGLDHAIDGVAAAAAHTDYLDPRPALFFIVKLNAYLCGFNLLLIHSGWRLPIRR